MISDEHLFRREAPRMVAALTRIFGMHNLGLAEDVVQDAFCRALEIWKLRGVPENPAAWLLITAKNRAIDVLRRERKFRDFAPELDRLHESEWTLVPTIEEYFQPSMIKDDQLRMMFSCCDPRLSEAAQIALVLHLMCGFGAREIAGAFLSGVAAIEKRIARAKRALAGSKRLFDLTDRDFANRLTAVRRALYLLFNEGYHGASSESVVRVELCQEAMRLAAMLLDFTPAATPASLALCALMCLHAARVPARVDAAGDLTPLDEQDRSLWDASLVKEGRWLLDLSAVGLDLTEFHVEAAIAAVHADARNAKETDWAQIVSLYDKLLALAPSPIVALNRAIALAQTDGPAKGLSAIRAIADADPLAAYPFYHAAIAELELRGGSNVAARLHFQAAAAVARNPMERRFLERRALACT